MSVKVVEEWLFVIDAMKRVFLLVLGKTVELDLFLTVLLLCEVLSVHSR